MSGDYVPAVLRHLLIQQSGSRCGYCLVQQDLHYGPLEVEHIVPRSRGGLTVADNLWLACRVCNGYKSDRSDFSWRSYLRIKLLQKYEKYG